jgi:hypothetical protein
MMGIFDQQTSDWNSREDNEQREGVNVGKGPLIITNIDNHRLGDDTPFSASPLRCRYIAFSSTNNISFVNNKLEESGGYFLGFLYLVANAKMGPAWVCLTLGWRFTHL